MINTECDKCGKVAKGVKGQTWKLPEGWYLLEHGRYPKVYYHICPACRKGLGIPDPVEAQTVGEKLLDTLTDLIGEQVADVIENG